MPDARQEVTSIVGQFVAFHPGYFPVPGEEPHLDSHDKGVTARVTIRPAGSAYPQVVTAHGSTPAEAGQNLLQSLDQLAKFLALEALMTSFATLEEGIAKARMAVDSGGTLDLSFLHAANTAREAAGRYEEALSVARRG